ncbi:hypothetical protein B0H14DRAFT_2573203 [Mycena olivaceomarginata]|nr:hypothetical protein B0H14DRAFT_2573203 [Mycena olivaceomarginata]
MTQAEVLRDPRNSTEMIWMVEKEIECRHEIEIELASPRVLVMLGKAGVRSVEKAGVHGQKGGGEDKMLHRMEGGDGGHRSVSQKASPEVLEVLGKAEGAKNE